MVFGTYLPCIAHESYRHWSATKKVNKIAMVIRGFPSLFNLKRLVILYLTEKHYDKQMRHITSLCVAVTKHCLTIRFAVKPGNIIDLPT